jgi:hypothetical protein
MPRHGEERAFRPPAAAGGASGYRVSLGSFGPDGNRTVAGEGAADVLAFHPAAARRPAYGNPAGVGHASPVMR